MCCSDKLCYLIDCIHFHPSFKYKISDSFMYYPKKGKVKCAQLFAQWNNITRPYYKKLEHCVNDD